MLTKREKAAKLVCFSIASLLIVSSFFREASEETIIVLLGGLCWYILGKLSFAWIDKLP